MASVLQRAAIVAIVALAPALAHADELEQLELINTNLVVYFGGLNEQIDSLNATADYILADADAIVASLAAYSVYLAAIQTNTETTAIKCTAMVDAIGVTNNKLTDVIGRLDSMLDKFDELKDAIGEIGDKIDDAAQQAHNDALQIIDELATANDKLDGIRDDLAAIDSTLEDGFSDVADGLQAIADAIEELESGGGDGDGDGRINIDDSGIVSAIQQLIDALNNRFDDLEDVLTNPTTGKPWQEETNEKLDDLNDSQRDQDDPEKTPYQKQIRDDFRNDSGEFTPPSGIPSFTLGASSEMPSIGTSNYHVNIPFPNISNFADSNSYLTFSFNTIPQSTEFAQSERLFLVGLIRNGLALAAFFGMVTRVMRTLGG